MFGFAGAFRRSELVSLDVEDLVFSPAGIEVLIRRSKTDPLGAGRKVGIPFGGHRKTCPVRAPAPGSSAPGSRAGRSFAASIDTGG